MRGPHDKAKIATFMLVEVRILGVEQVRACRERGAAAGNARGYALEAGRELNYRRRGGTIIRNVAA
jgi:hypothetical protein